MFSTVLTPNDRFERQHLRQSGHGFTIDRICVTNGSSSRIVKILFNVERQGFDRQQVKEATVVE